MTITLEKWQEKDGDKVAIIEQAKYQYNCTMSVCMRVDNLRLQTIFHNDYTSIKAARQAIKRFGNFEKMEV